MTKVLSIISLSNFPDINNGDDLCEILWQCIIDQKMNLYDGDIICLAHKVVSKAEGRIIALSDVQPTSEAFLYAKKLNKDPRKIEVILQESKKVVRAFRHEHQSQGIMICQHRLGFISANAAVDESNIEGKDNVLLLPLDPDKSAFKLRSKLEKKFNAEIGVVITDTFGRPWRLGQVNVAIGISGIPATICERGKVDAYGKELFVTEPAFCDEVAAASGLLTAKAAKAPVTIFRGLSWVKQNSKAIDILRSEEENMFI